MKKRIKVLINGVLIAMAVGLVACTVAAFFDDGLWLGYLAAQFRVQYVVAGFVLAGLLAACKNYRFAVASLLCGALNMPAVAPYFAGGAHEGIAKSAGVRVSLLQVNLNYKNDRFDDVLAVVRETKSDLLLFEEVTPIWESKLTSAAFAKEYPYRTFEARTDTMGIGMMSKVPVADLRVDHFAGLPFPSIVGTVLPSGNAQFCLIHTHFMGPMQPARWQNQLAQMKVVTERAALATVPVVVAGDLNAVPWTEAFRRMLTTGRLVDSQLQSGLQPSWPSGKPIVVLKPLGLVFAPDISFLRFLVCLPIDHFLVSPVIGTRDRQVGKYVGSDHLPVSIVLDVPVTK